MEAKDINLELKVQGSILDCRVFLEKTDEIGLWIFNNKDQFYYKSLPNFPITGGLEVKLVAKGKNGASAKLLVKIKGLPQSELICVIQKGVAIAEKTIIITTEIAKA